MPFLKTLAFFTTNVGVSCDCHSLAIRWQYNDVNKVRILLREVHEMLYAG